MGNCPFVPITVDLGTPKNIPKGIRLNCLLSVAGGSKLSDGFGNGTRLGCCQPHQRNSRCLCPAGDGCSPDRAAMASGALGGRVLERLPYQGRHRRPCPTRESFLVPQFLFGKELVSEWPLWRIDPTAYEKADLPLCSYPSS